LISGEDLAPTFLAAGGVESPKDMTGRSFLPLLKGDSYKPREYVFAQRGAHGSGLPTNSAAFDLGRCVVSKKHKLIYNALADPYHPSTSPATMWRTCQMNKGKPRRSCQPCISERDPCSNFTIWRPPQRVEELAGKAGRSKRTKAALWNG
jgi:hypothetical protein